LAKKGLRLKPDSISEIPFPRGRTLHGRACPILLALWVFLPAAYGQVSAVLSGTVSDQSGAVVATANVTVRDVDTGLSRSTVTDATGRYQFPFLPVGDYEVRANKPQFTETVRTSIHLVVGQSATLDVQLQVGQASQQITVRGDAPLVAVSTANVSGLISEQQVDLNHRFSSGFLLRGVYTWSKTIDDGDSLNTTTSRGEPALASNPFNLRADRGLANFDVRNVGVVNANYALPFGSGRHFLNTASGFGKALVGGWTANSIITVQGGFPFTPQLSYNPSNTGDTRNPVRPFVNPAFTGPVILGNPNEWFNPAAFLPPPNNSGFIGNLGRDTLIGPGLATWDFSLFTDTRIQEKTDLQFRAEFFNILNRANFNTPNAVVCTPTGVFSHRRRNHEHFDYITPDSVRPEAALVVAA
jgi:hypothetical protein